MGIWPVSCSYSPPRGKVDQLHHLAKLGEVLAGLDDLGQLEADGILLVHDLEQGVAQGRLVEKIVDLGHGELVAACWVLQWFVGSRQRARRLAVGGVEAPEIFPRFFSFSAGSKIFRIHELPTRKSKRGAEQLETWAKKGKKKSVGISNSPPR
jgi:hypothetical protein